MFGGIFYNYIYCDPRKPQPYKVPGIDLILPAHPFYVGRGKGGRKFDHMKWLDGCHSNDNNKHKINTIRAILKAGLQPIVIQINSGLSNLIANENEKYLIAKIGRADQNRGPLTNLTDGGDTISGNIKSPEAIAKMIETRKNSDKPWGHIKGAFNHSEKTKNKLRFANVGKKQSPETIAKRVANFTPAKMGAKKLLQFDFGGNLIKEWGSSIAASKYFGGVRRCLMKNGNNKSGGFVWVYEKDLKNKLQLIDGR